MLTSNEAPRVEIVHGTTESYDENSDESETVENISAFLESNRVNDLIDDVAKLI